MGRFLHVCSECGGVGNYSGVEGGLKHECGKVFTYDEWCELKTVLKSDYEI